MTTPFLVALTSALEQHLQAMNGYLGDANTKWENTTIPTVADQPYQEVFVLFAEPSNPERGGYIQQEGYAQINLRYPTNTGRGAALGMAQKIRDWFPKNLSLSANGVTVTISRTPAISPGANDGDRYQLPIKIRFIANNAT